MALLGGQFKSATHGQFKSAQGGHFDRILQYYEFGLQFLKYKSVQDLYEKLFLSAIVDSYRRIDKSVDIENNIRDRFIWDLERNNPITKELIDNNILQLDFERTHFVSQSEKKRTDIVFFISGFEKFTVECKCLHQQPSKNKSYLDEGLLRFVELKYADKSQYASMIGFIVSGNISEISRDIQKNVLNFYPSVSANENQVDLQWENSFVSLHECINKKNILVYHLLFPFFS